MLEQIRIVLVGTTHPGNIGAAARAMRNMGLSQLWLVAPKLFPHVEATARAAGADEILAQAQVVSDIDTALVGCRLVIGTSARIRELPITMLQPATCAATVLAEAKQGEVAVVFGRESSGLSNDELMRCHYHVHIPTVNDFSSLNLAQAVQIIVYEIYAATQTDIKYDLGEKQLATAEQMEQFYQHLSQTLLAIDFLDPQRQRKLMYRLRRLFNRTRVEENELHILRGILTAVTKPRSK